MIAGVKAAIKSLLPRKTFVRNASILAGGTAGAQLLTVLAAPILTRLYSPEDFGLLAVYASLLALIGVAASLRYELAILLPESDEEAANVLALGFLALLGMTLVAAGVMVIFGPSIANALGVPNISDYLWLLPFGVLLGGACTVLNYWALRSKSFATIAGTNLRQVVVSLLIQTAFFKLGGIALLFGQVAGQGMGTWCLARLAIKKLAFENISWNQVRRASIRYKQFPFFSVWGSLANTAGVMLPAILFAGYFGVAAAGLYHLANRVLQLPLALIGGAIGHVFFSEAAEAKRKEKISELVAGLHSKLAHIGMGPALLLILIGPDLFEMVFGEEWRVAGELAQLMVPWLYLVFVSSPLSTLFAVMEKELQSLVFQLVLLVARLGAILVGTAIGGLMETVFFFSVASFLCMLGFLIWLARLAGTSLRSVFYPTLSALTINTTCLLPMILVTSIGSGVGLFWFVALLVSSALLGVRYWALLREQY